MSAPENGKQVLEQPLLASLAKAASAGVDPDPDLILRLRAALPGVAGQVPLPPPGQPYSRHTLHCGDGVEIMAARWTPLAECAPHDHGGSSGFVVVLDGTLAETHYTWRDRDLVAAAQMPRASGSVRGFGPRVIHAMSAGASGGVTLHVYSPPPQRMNVYDLRRREVLDLVGDFGAWIPAGEHPRTPFETAAP